MIHTPFSGALLFLVAFANSAAFAGTLIGADTSGFLYSIDVEAGERDAFRRLGVQFNGLDYNTKERMLYATDIFAPGFVRYGIYQIDPVDLSVTRVFLHGPVLPAIDGLAYDPIRDVL